MSKRVIHFGLGAMLLALSLSIDIVSDVRVSGKFSRLDSLAQFF
jgi:hypothetical protein